MSMYTKLVKAWFSLTHPCMWRALMRGVAPSIEHMDVLNRIRCDLILDVGANRGQFSLMARSLHPGVVIHAYEPQPSEAAIYRACFQRYKDLVLHEIALGEQSGSTTLHISRRADSSSILPIGELQAKLFPRTEAIGTCEVDVVALDSFSEHWRVARCALLKLDVQGFELSVLRGARLALKHCAYVFAECSEVPLYTGQALAGEIVAFLKGEGFFVAVRSNEQWIGGRLIQADYLFVREL